MKYTKLNNKIIIEDLSQFNIKQIFDCGQIFRYYINNNVAEVVSKDKYAQIVTYDDKIEINTKDVDYFEYFFDLNNDYSVIKNSLSGDTFLASCIKY
ncbi:MAG: 8-oxoguanine DNA glycosylase, partial [Clostridia bacterium]|nr:8-oxoguanine DNA glycosylase [Clostridia bacterium]